MAFPKQIDKTEHPHGLKIIWDDDHAGLYPFAYLRRACPCALCKGETVLFNHTPPPQKDLTPEAFEARELFKVGQYAIGIRWKDGHDSGIYQYPYLREICACESCVLGGKEKYQSVESK